MLWAFPLAGGYAMPQTIIRTGFLGPDGNEEILSEYLCDCPDCPNKGDHVIAIPRGLGGPFVVCAEHAAALRRQARGR
jgi:hypothetical protein